MRIFRRVSVVYKHKSGPVVRSTNFLRRNVVAQHFVKKYFPNAIHPMRRSISFGPDIRTGPVGVESDVVGGVLCATVACRFKMFG